MHFPRAAGVLVHPTSFPRPLRHRRSGRICLSLYRFSGEQPDNHCGRFYRLVLPAMVTLLTRVFPPLPGIPC